jgi:hypothetical protein
MMNRGHWQTCLAPSIHLRNWKPFFVMKFVEWQITQQDNRAIFCPLSSKLPRNTLIGLGKSNSVIKSNGIERNYSHTPLYSSMPKCILHSYHMHVIFWPTLCHCSGHIWLTDLTSLTLTAMDKGKIMQAKWGVSWLTNYFLKQKM